MNTYLTRILLSLTIGIIGTSIPAQAADKKKPDPNKSTTVTATITAVSVGGKTVTIEVAGKKGSKSYTLNVGTNSTITVDHMKADISGLKTKDPAKVEFKGKDLVTLDVEHTAK